MLYEVITNIQCRMGSREESANINIEEVFMEQEQIIKDDGENKILLELKRFVAGLFEIDILDIDENVSFFELGIDSISIIRNNFV